jgi:hypothetical protein
MASQINKVEIARQKQMYEQTFASFKDSPYKHVQDIYNTTLEGFDRLLNAGVRNIESKSRDLVPTEGITPPDPSAYVNMDALSGGGTSPEREIASNTKRSSDTLESIAQFLWTKVAELLSNNNPGPRFPPATDPDADRAGG